MITLALLETPAALKITVRTVPLAKKERHTNAQERRLSSSLIQ